MLYQSASFSEINGIYNTIVPMVSEVKEERHEETRKTVEERHGTHFQSAWYADRVSYQLIDEEANC